MPSISPSRIIPLHLDKGRSLVPTMHRTVPGKEAIPGDPLTARVLVVDDHAVVRKGICQILSAVPELDVVCETASGEEAVAKAEEHRSISRM